MTLTKRLTRRSIALAASTTLALTGLAALPHQAAANEPLTWKSTTFGQSTDLNFSSNVLPEKVGTNSLTPMFPARSRARSSWRAVAARSPPATTD